MLNINFPYNLIITIFKGGFREPPRPRMGHTLVKAIRKNTNAPDDIFLVMFGGRDNDNITTHIPKTYNVEIVEGRIKFTTYTDKPVRLLLINYFPHNVLNKISNIYIYMYIYSFYLPNNVYVESPCNDLDGTYWKLTPEERAQRCTVRTDLIPVGMYKINKKHFIHN